MDTLTRTERSKRLALIHGKNTKPELLVRKIARSCGYRFRLHVPNLPGKPDIVFPRQRKVIFDPQIDGKPTARSSEHGAATSSLIQDDWSR